MISGKAGSSAAREFEPRPLRVRSRLDGEVREELARQGEDRRLELRVVEKVGAADGDAPHVGAVTGREGDHEGTRIRLARLGFAPANAQ